MQITLEQHDIEAIADATVEKIKPLLKHEERLFNDCLFTRAEAAKFLNVKPSWLDNNEVLGKCKFGGHVRYRKSKLIRWIDEQEIPTTSLKVT